ncbi:MAG TPA: hydroxymethylglutaryl-CoA lyase [Acidimicrobiia bacterium]
MSRPRVHIVDVAPRDGLQSDAVMFSTEQKAELIRRIVDAGIERVEVASFVNPKRVPQMADAEAVLDAVSADTRARYIGLVLNERGFDRALSAHTPEVNVVVACTDTFSERNQGMNTAAAIDAATAVIRRARDAAIPCSATLSAAFGCGYEGEVPLARVLDVVERVAAAGPDEIALADTVGAAVPPQVRERFTAAAEVLHRAPRPIGLRAHFHNTRNAGVANALAAVEVGVPVIDASLGGIGGCPFAPRATGNIPTEDVVFLLERSGYDTGVDLDRLIAASEWLAGQLGRDTPSLVAKAGPFPPAA